MPWSTRRFGSTIRNHLLIGDRWMPGTANSEVLVTTAAKYLDVVSVNYYTYGIDKGFLDRIHGWAEKPLLFSEFYYAVADQGLQGGSKVNSQAERGLAYRNYVEQSAATGYVVGIQWFLALDQACTGRFFEGFNGEAANTGLVNVADRPYKDFLAEAMKTNYTIYDVVLGGRPPYAFDDPRFAARRAGRRQDVGDFPHGQPVRARWLPCPLACRFRPCPDRGSTAWSKGSDATASRPPSGWPGTTPTCTCSSRSPIPRR